jgi:hypothetical protein
MRFRCSIWRHFEREYEVQRRRWLSILPWVFGCDPFSRRAARLHDRLQHQCRRTIVSGLLGLLLLWPNSERARLIGQAASPELVPSN